MPLRVVDFTVGALTRWMRWVLETDGGLICFEVRYAAHDDSDRNATEFIFCDTRGRSLEEVRSDAAFVAGTTAETVTTIRATIGPSLLVMRGVLPFEGLGLIESVLDALLVPQDHSDELFMAPNFLTVTDEQHELAKRLSNIYDGTPFESEWDRGSIPALGKQAAQVALPGNPFQLTYLRELTVGEVRYGITHPLVRYLYSVHSETGQANADEETVIWPGDDRRQVHWAIPEWQRGAG